MTQQSATKLAHRRLQMLEFGEALGNISEACRKLGVSRSQFYVYKQRYQEQGIEGLKDLPPIHKTHPQTTPPAVVEQVLEWAITQPVWGCEKISLKLKQAGIQLSAVTVQDILNKHATAAALRGRKAAPGGRDRAGCGCDRCPGAQ